jgi:hypothetical protein
VPVYSNPEFEGVPGYEKAMERARAERAEFQAALEREAAREAARAFSSDLSRHLQGEPVMLNDAPRGLPLHAYELSADDAALLNALAGSYWAPTATLMLPSGRVVSGDEIARWVQSQGGV